MSATSLCTENVCHRHIDMMLEDILWVGKVWLIRVPGIHPGPSVARMLIRPGIVGRRTNHQKKPLIIRSKDSRVGQHMPYTSSCAIAKLFGGWLFCQLVVSLLEVASRPASNTGFSRRPWDGSNLSLWKACLCLMSFCSSQLFLGQVTTANIAWVTILSQVGLCVHNWHCKRGPHQLSFARRSNWQETQRLLSWKYCAMSLPLEVMKNVWFEECLIVYYWCL